MVVEREETGITRDGNSSLLGLSKHVGDCNGGRTKD